jgi:Ca-activated chloride channel family protein
MIQGQVDEQGGPVNVLILIDSSYSMKDKLGEGEPKMISAKRVLESTLARIPPDVNIGLRVFGQGYSGSPEIDCQQSSLLVSIGNGNRRSIIEQVRQLRPFGLTPLTFALMQAERDLRRANGQKTIILISDGAETCGGDPCEYISRLHRLGVNIKVDIVGLGLRRERDARGQLNCIAEHSGGKYYDANSAAELADSISHMVNAAISGRVIPKASHPSTGNPAETPAGGLGGAGEARTSGSSDGTIPMPTPVVPGK